MNKTVEFVSRVSRYLARLGGVMILLSAFLVSLDVLFRNLFQLTIFESFELTGYGIALATVFGLSWSLITKAHIRIEVVYNILAEKPRAYLDVLALGALAVMACLLTYYGLQVVINNVQLGARSNSTLHIPLGIPQGLWALGLAWFAICSVMLFVVSLMCVLRGRHDQVQKLFGIASVAEEVDASMEGTGVEAVSRSTATVAGLNVKAGA